MAMTNSAYVSKHGLYCPFCGSRQVETQFPFHMTQRDEATMIQDTSCGECKKEWLDIFTLTGFEKKED